MNHSICIIGALKDEISGIKGRMEIHETVPAGAGRAFCGIWRHRRVILVRSGIGRELAEKALEEICGQYSVSEIVSIGFAGGLGPDLKTGDLVVADSVREALGGNEKSSADSLLPMDSHLLDGALKLSFPEELTVKSGCLVTVDRPACSLQEKRRLYERYSAVAVDMETSALLRLALANEIPFLSVRVISDSANQELVDFSHCVNENGEVSRLKAGWHVITHPGLLPKVETLRQATRSAAKNLTQYLDEWIVHTR